MDTFRDIFSAFGGPARFAAETGIKPYHAQTMRARDSIPPAHWPAVVAAAKRIGLSGVTYEALALMRARTATGAAA